MSEIFKQVEEFPKLLVSNKGRVFVNGGDELRYSRLNGRKVISFPKNGQYVRRQVGALVLIAFREERPLTKYLVKHIDGNEDNNRLENLRWVRRTTTIGKEYHLSNSEQTFVFQTLVEAGEFLGIKRKHRSLTSAMVKPEAERQGFKFSIEKSKYKRKPRESKMPLPDGKNDFKLTSSPEKKKFINQEIHKFVDYCDTHYSTNNANAKKGLIKDIDESDPVVIAFRKFQKQYKV